MYIKYKVYKRLYNIVLMYCLESLSKTMNDGVWIMQIYEFTFFLEVRPN